MPGPLCRRHLGGREVPGLLCAYTIWEGSRVGSVKSLDYAFLRRTKGSKSLQQTLAFISTENSVLWPSTYIL